MVETWVDLPVEGCAEYSVSNAGRIRRDDTDRIIKPIKNTTGYLQVGLYNNGVRRKYGLNRLVANAFLAPPKEDHYNTLLHKDGDRQNSSATNLEWRPRWFVVKYHQQFETWETDGRVRIVVEVNSGREFASLTDVVVEYGLLYVDLVSAIHNGTSPMFAGGRIFRFR